MIARDASKTDNRRDSDRRDVAEDHLPCVAILVAGERSYVEAAIFSARRLYPGRELAFVCEPSHRAWLPLKPGDRIFVVEQPFNPFGRRASELRKDLESVPIAACAVIVGIAFQSVRFRVFALRLQTSCFFILRAASSELPKPINRASFALLLGATLFLKCIYPLRVIARGILPLIARLLARLDQPFAVGLAWLAKAFMRSRRLQNRERGKEIVHVIPSVGMGGVQRQLVLFLKNRSPAYNHRVVVLRSGDRFFSSEAAECGVPIFYLDSKAVRQTFVRLQNRRWVLDVFEPLVVVLKESLPMCSEIMKLVLFFRSLKPQPDIVHCWLLFANLVGSIAARLAGVSLLVTSVRNIQSQVHYNYYNPRWQAILERATVPLSSAITANAAAVAADYRAFTGASAEKVVTVPNGIDVKAFHLLAPEERVEKRRSLGFGVDTVVVGTVARLAKEKDFETFIRAVALAQQQLPTIRSVIVGEGVLRDDLKAFASSLSLTGLIHFLGERKDVGDLIQCFDVFLLTSIIEGMPNAVMESQLLSVPVVATKAGGTVDLIQHGETGLLAPIGDYQTLASCILRIFAEDELRKTVSRAASQQIRSGYTVEQFVTRTEAVYRALLDGKNIAIAHLCAE